VPRAIANPKTAKVPPSQTVITIDRQEILDVSETVTFSGGTPKVGDGRGVSLTAAAASQRATHSNSDFKVALVRAIVLSVAPLFPAHSGSGTRQIGGMNNRRSTSNHRACVTAGRRSHVLAAAIAASGSASTALAKATSNSGVMAAAPVDFE
jgi:hypothetical protein